jgi:hypothetical protein
MDWLYELSFLLFCRIPIIIDFVYIHLGSPHSILQGKTFVCLKAVHYLRKGSVSSKALKAIQLFIFLRPQESISIMECFAIYKTKERGINVVCIVYLSNVKVSSRRVRHVIVMLTRLLRLPRSLRWLLGYLNTMTSNDTIDQNTRM